MVLVHAPFATVAKVQCELLGAKDPLIVVYKQDAPAFESDEASERKAADVATEVFQLLKT